MKYSRRDVSYFEAQWKPKVPNRRFRFLFVRTRTKRQQKGPVRLDLFLPYEYGYDFKVVVTNKLPTRQFRRRRWWPSTKAAARRKAPSES